MNHNDAIRLFAKTLQNLGRWMDKAAEHAQARSFEVDVLTQARLAPDQFPFIRQVRILFASWLTSHCTQCFPGEPAVSYIGEGKIL